MKINLKKNILAISVALFSFSAMGQTNSFPVSGNVGIGVTAPADLLEINSGTVRKGITIKGDGTSGVFNDLVFTMNTKPAPALHKVNTWIMSHRKDGYFTNSPIGESSLEFYALRTNSYYAPLSFKSNGDVILVSNRNAVSGNVAIGTTDTKGYKLAVNGNISAKEIKVEATVWPDYVFDAGHQVLSLRELEDYIKLHKHLPEIPSAAEVKKDGIALGEMNKMLLKKIEELTLYLIEKDKEISQLRNQQLKIEDQESRIKRLERLLEKSAEQ
ncbi:hypothetical protein SAMN05421820_105107 [Pedobacter steynii]|uniref:Cell wall anchor protein n=1 Tax=Pedobacter steynii TaxID=430522 RepID=A0A1G9W9U6_9SPHI|nr:hypothetical protein [Pedobacter steynii]NQX40224.1 hypothetical protein [Pedobacter steynii]SDM81270.1 hypothetical protein SAMN05421820_105107 [Pedobacter steynii]